MKEVFNCIREFTRQFQTHFIVTGSYLGRVLEPDFRFSSGDVTSIRIFTLSFQEFLETFDPPLYQEYSSLPLDHADDRKPEIYNELQSAFDVYKQIGGYPKVVETYLNTKSILLREKKGLDEGSISEELQKLVMKNHSSNLSKATCFRAINWLYQSWIVGYCGKIIEMDILNFKPSSRCFFMDLGITYYYLSRSGADAPTRSGTLNENYVYIDLLKRQEFPEEIAFETPAFATYKGGEIDFVAQNIQSSTRYLIEVKSGKGTPALKALEQGKAQKLLYLKGDTRGGANGKVETLPIYLLERYQFD